MSKASNKEEEGINDAKLALEREQSKMRAEVDQELRKIGDLYQERCRDYATMVSDDCEASISKAVAGKKPILRSHLLQRLSLWSPYSG